jgi:hypothetical protein
VAVTTCGAQQRNKRNKQEHSRPGSMMPNRPLREQIKTGRSKQRPYGGHLGEASVARVDCGAVSYAKAAASRTPRLNQPSVDHG